MYKQTFNISVERDVLRLGQELRVKGFAADWFSIQEMILDLDWYQHGPPDWKSGFHPVAGSEGSWNTYMIREHNQVWLVVEGET